MADLRTQATYGEGWSAVAELEFSDGLLAISNADASIIYTRPHPERNAAGSAYAPRVSNTLADA